MTSASYQRSTKVLILEMTFSARTTLGKGEAVVRTVTVRQTGTSVSATIPKEIAERLHIDAGDKVFMVETENGVLLTPYDPTVEQAMNVYTRGAKKYREALRRLAR